MISCLYSVMVTRFHNGALVKFGYHATLSRWSSRVRASYAPLALRRSLNGENVMFFLTRKTTVLFDFEHQSKDEVSRPSALAIALVAQ